MIDPDALPQAIEAWGCLDSLPDLDAAIIARALSASERQELAEIISRARAWLVRLETHMADDAAIVADYLGGIGRD